MKLPGTFTKCPNDILEDPRVSGLETKAYLVIRAHCVKKETCWPSVETISTILGKQRRQVVRCINNLETLGYLKREKRLGTSSRFVFTCDVQVTGGVTSKSQGCDMEVTGGVTFLVGGCDVQVTQKQILETDEKKQIKRGTSKPKRPDLAGAKVVKESNPEPKAKRFPHSPMSRDQVAAKIALIDLEAFQDKYPDLVIEDLIQDFTDWALWQNDIRNGRPNYEKWSDWTRAFHTRCRNEMKYRKNNGSRPKPTTNVAAYKGYEGLLK